MRLVELGQDDTRMAEYSDLLLNRVHISEQASSNLATTIYEEVHTYASEHPYFSVSDVMPYKERFNEVALFMNWFAASSEHTDLTNHARLVLSNYMCFVYLGDVCFVRLRNKLPASTATQKCCRYLTENPVRAFRNAIAHGNWRVLDGKVQYWARKGASKDDPIEEFEVPDTDRHFWFFLALCTGKSAFAALSTLSPSPIQ